MNIFKKIQDSLDLNKKIKEEEKQLKTKKDEIYSKIIDECIDFSYEFFNNNLINDFKADWKCLKYAKQRKQILVQAMDYCLGCCQSMLEVDMWMDGYIMGLETQTK